MDRLRLPANLIRFCFVSDRLRTGIHVALTARRELYSRSIPCLEEPQGAHVKGHKQGQPEHRAHSIENKQERNDDACGKSHDSKHEPLAALSRADVGDAH
jgi:hypothetical protein